MSGPIGNDWHHLVLNREWTAHSSRTLRPPNDHPVEILGFDVLRFVVTALQQRDELTLTFSSLFCSDLSMSVRRQRSYTSVAQPNFRESKLSEVTQLQEERSVARLRLKPLTHKSVWRCQMLVDDTV